MVEVARVPEDAEGTPLQDVHETSNITALCLCELGHPSRCCRVHEAGHQNSEQSRWARECVLSVGNAWGTAPRHVHECKLRKCPGSALPSRNMQVIVPFSGSLLSEAKSAASVKSILIARKKSFSIFDGPCPGRL